jgi:hypothetical protein
VHVLCVCVCVSVCLCLCVCMCVFVCACMYVLCVCVRTVPEIRACMLMTSLRAVAERDAAAATAAAAAALAAAAAAAPPPIPAAPFLIGAVVRTAVGAGTVIAPPRPEDGIVAVQLSGCVLGARVGRVRASERACVSERAHAYLMVCGRVAQVHGRRVHARGAADGGVSCRCAPHVVGACCGSRGATDAACGDREQRRRWLVYIQDGRWGR